MCVNRDQFGVPWFVRDLYSLVYNRPKIMNSWSVFIVFIALVYPPSALCSEEEDRIKLIYTKCREETQIEEDEIESFKKMELPKTNKGKCMMGCLMREASIIVNGRFHKEGALKVAERYYKEKAEDMEKAKTVIDICEKMIESETEECEIAGKLATCVIDEAQKIGLSSIPQG